MPSPTLYRKIQMKSIIIFTLIITIGTIGIIAAPPPLKWKMPFSELPSMPDVIIELSDTTILCGSAVIRRSDGEIIDSITDLDPRVFSLTDNGGFICAEGNRLILFNPGMQRLWSVEIGSQAIESVVQIKDLGFAALTADHQIILTDHDGMQTSIFPIGPAVYYPSDSLNPIDTVQKFYPDGITCQDDGIIVYGRSMIGSSVDCWLLKYSTNGAEMWRTLLGGITPREVVSLGESIVLSGDIDYKGWRIHYQNNEAPSLSKRCYFPDSKVPLIQIGTDGTILMHEDFYSTSYNYGQSLTIDDSTCFIGYFTYEPPIFEDNLSAASIIAVNQNGGKKLWSIDYPNTHLSASEAHIQPLRAQPLASGGLLIAALDTLYCHETALQSVNYGKEPMTLKSDIRYLNLQEDRISYTLETPADLSISIYTLNGRPVSKPALFRKQAGCHSYRLPRLSSGTWLVRCTINRSEITFRRIIR